MSELIRLGESVFPYLLDAAWKATALMVIVFGLARTLGRRRLVARYWLWVYCLAGLLLLPVTSFIARDHRLALLPRKHTPAALARASSLSKSPSDVIDPSLVPKLTDDATSAEAVLTVPSEEKATDESPASEVSQPGAATKVSAPERVQHEAETTGAAVTGSAVQPSRIAASSQAQRPPDQAVSKGDSAFPWRGWLTLGWLAGCAVFLARLLFAGICVVRLRRSSSPIGDSAISELFEAAKNSAGAGTRAKLAVGRSIGSPVCIGIFRPTILLPESLVREMPPEQLRPIVLHELAHIHWGDYAVNILQRIAEAVFFFHPLVWLVNLRLRSLREEICDNWVIDRSRDRALYARALTELAGRTICPRPGRVATLGLFSHCPRIRRRIERILSSEKRPAIALGLKTAVGLLSISLAIVGFLSLTSLSARAVERTEKAAIKETEPAPPKIVEGEELKKVSFMKTLPRFMRYEFPPLPVLLMRDGRAMIPAQRIWADTGLDVTEGQVVSVSATGRVRGCHGPTGSWDFGPWGPEGTMSEGSEYEGNKVCALIGRIGSGENREEFYIGKKLAFKAPASGRFYLGVADINHIDNEAAFVAEVKIDGKPVDFKALQPSKAIPEAETAAPYFEPSARSAARKTAGKSAEPDIGKPPIDLEEIPGAGVFKGTYKHWSRGREYGRSEQWIKQGKDGAITAATKLRSSVYIARGDKDNRLVEYSVIPEEESGYKLEMSIEEGKVIYKQRMPNKEEENHELSVPEGHVFDPNTRPDPYSAANILLRAFDLKKGEIKQVNAYDWDNTGKDMATYTFRIANTGKEKVTVPAGTFEANHIVLTQLSTGDTWYKKRAMHVTDFWVLDNGVIVRILRHREPYEVQLQAVEWAVPAFWGLEQPVAEAKLLAAEVPSPSPEKRMKKVPFMKTLPRFIRQELPPLPVLVMDDGKAMVPAQRIWSDTGLDVAEGQTIAISADGQVRGCHLPMGDWAMGPWGPEGTLSERTPYSGNKVCALIGKVESDGKVEEFYIGRELTLKAPLSGRLYLGVSDIFHIDNEGAFVVDVKIDGKRVDFKAVRRAIAAQEEAKRAAARKFGKRAVVAVDGSGDTTSIQEAIDGVNEGGTVSIKAGTYRELLTISKAVTVEGAGRDVTRIEATGERKGERWVAVGIQSCEDVTLKGLMIASGTRISEQSGLVLVAAQDADVSVEECNLLWAQYGIAVSGNSNARIEKCLVAGIWGTGIAIGRDASATVTNCEVRNCYHRCITVRSKGDVRIENNLISGSAWHGIRYDHCSPTIVGNVINNHARCGIYASGSGEAKIINNLFLRNEMCGVSTWYRTNPLVRNNTFVENTRGGLEMDVTTRPVVEYNIFFANETAASRFYTSSSRQFADSSPPPQLSHNLLWENKEETPPPPRPREEVMAEHEEKIEQAEEELAKLKEQYGEHHLRVAAQEHMIESLKSVLKQLEPAAPYKPPELSFSDTALRDDPLFVDADADNYNLRSASPARGAGKDGADIGAKLTISVKLQYPITPEEKLIIPNTDSRDFKLWKKGTASPPARVAERKPAPTPAVGLPTEVIIDVRKGGKFVVHRVEKSSQEISEMLQQIAKERPDARVIVRAHRESPYKNILEVLDACKKANLSNVSFAVTPDPERVKPQPTPVPPTEAKAEQYVPPDYEGFFPDDPEGARKLDALGETGVFRSTLPDEEILEIVRKGLRRTTNRWILRALGNRYIWGKYPQHPKAIEIMYHATDGPDMSNAVYFGLSVVIDKSPSILRTLVDICMRSDDPNVLSRVAWGAKSQRGEILPYLAPYLNSADEATQEKARIVEKILKGELKAFAWATEKARARAEAKFTDKLPEIKEKLLHGGSETRREVLKLINRNAITLIMDDSFIEAWKACAEDQDWRIRNQVARTFGGRWMWSAPEQKPEAIDLILQLSKDEVREVRYNSVYFGLSTVRDKSEAVVRRLLEIAMEDREWNMFSRIQWGLRGSQAVAAKILEGYMDQYKTDRESASAAFSIYKDIVGKPAPHPERFRDVSTERQVKNPGRMLSGEEEKMMITQDETKNADDKGEISPPVESLPFKVADIALRPVDILFMGFFQTAGGDRYVRIKWGENAERAFVPVGNFFHDYEVCALEERHDTKELPDGSRHAATRYFLTIKKRGGRPVCIREGETVRLYEMVATLRALDSKWLVGHRHEVVSKGEETFDVYGGYTIAEMAGERRMFEVIEVCDRRVLLKGKKGEGYRLSSSAKAGPPFLYVEGQVKRPGQFSFASEGKMTLLGAITMAGGFSRIAKKKVILITTDDAGKEKRMEVDVSEILKKPELDPPLKAGDIIYVPESY